MIRTTTFAIVATVLALSSAIANEEGQTPITICASFELFPDNTNLGSGFSLAGYLFRELGGGASLFVNESGGGIGLQFPREGVHVTLPTTVSAVEFTAAAFAGPVTVDALDSGGNIVRHTTVSNGVFQTVRLFAPEIVALQFADGSNEGIISEICVTLRNCCKPASNPVSSVDLLYTIRQTQKKAHESGLYEGTSHTGDLSDAILNAANAALASNPTFVRWDLVAVNGARGGVVGAKDVTAIIRVRRSDEVRGPTDLAGEYSAADGSRNTGYIELRNETEDLAEVIITVSNWRYTQNWSVQNNRPLTLRDLPSVGYGVAAFNPNHPRRRAIGGDAFQLAVPFEVTVTGKVGDYQLEIHPLEHQKASENERGSDELEIAVSSRNYRFTIDGNDNPPIRVKQGAKVKIVLTSNGGTHDWVVADDDGEEEEVLAQTPRVKKGEPAVAVVFTADRVGDHVYYCSVSNHRRRGMEGRFIVEP